MEGLVMFCMFRLYILSLQNTRKRHIDKKRKKNNNKVQQIIETLNSLLWSNIISKQKEFYNSFFSIFVEENK